MKNINLLMVLALCCFAFSACDKEENTAEPSEVTFLPFIEIQGEQSITLDCDASGYTDEGATATESGTDIPLNTTVSGVYFGSPDINGPDRYEITYSAFNKDSIPGSQVRKIVWPVCNGDLVNSIAGMYTAYLSRTGPDGSVLATPQYQEVGPIYIRDMGDDVYAISDAIGGWYEYGRSLGITYTAKGMTVKANDISANDFDLSDPIIVGGFGGELEMTDFTVDAAAKEINIHTSWEFGFTFDVRLVQNP